MHDAANLKLMCWLAPSAEWERGLKSFRLPETFSIPKLSKQSLSATFYLVVWTALTDDISLNKIAVFYSVPYFDLGIKLVADGEGGVEQICGTVHYLQPDRSSLLSRPTYTLDQFEAASLKRANPDEYKKRLGEKYIVGANEERPAVISVNVLIASLAVNELLVRIHRFRDDGNEKYAATRVSLTQAVTLYEPETEPCRMFARHAGRGDVSPLLEMSELSEEVMPESEKSEAAAKC